MIAFVTRASSDLRLRRPRAILLCFYPALRKAGRRDILREAFSSKSKRKRDTAFVVFCRIKRVFLTQCMCVLRVCIYTRACLLRLLSSAAIRVIAVFCFFSFFCSPSHRGRWTRQGGGCTSLFDTCHTGI